MVGETAAVAGRRDVRAEEAGQGLDVLGLRSLPGVGSGGIDVPPLPWGQAVPAVVGLHRHDRAGRHPPASARPRPPFPEPSPPWPPGGTPCGSATPNGPRGSSWRPSSPRTRPGKASTTTCSPGRRRSTTTRCGRSPWRSAAAARSSRSPSSAGRSRQAHRDELRQEELRQEGPRAATSAPTAPAPPPRRPGRRSPPPRTPWAGSRTPAGPGPAHGAAGAAQDTPKGGPPFSTGRPPFSTSDVRLTGCTDRSRSPPAERPGRSPCRTASSRCRRSRRPSTSRPWPPRSARPGCCGSGTGPYRPG